MCRVTLEDIQNCMVHSAITDHCLNGILLHNHFKLDDVVAQVNGASLMYRSGAIRFDLIRRLIEMDEKDGGLYGEKLIPVCENFYSHLPSAEEEEAGVKLVDGRVISDRQWRIENANLCNARGNGRGTVGYATASALDGSIALAHAEMLTHRTAGHINGVTKRQNDLIKHEMLPAQGRLQMLAMLNDHLSRHASAAMEDGLIESGATAPLLEGPEVRDGA